MEYYNFLMISYRIYFIDHTIDHDRASIIVVLYDPYDKMYVLVTDELV